MKPTLTEPCIFCPNPRTNKRGEHVWDDWLNREDGKEIRRPSTTTQHGLGGVLLREYPSNQLDVTLPVVCDSCNNTWMSELSNEAKKLLEPTIRHDRPRDFNLEEILTITAFAFLKSAVLDSIRHKSRTPCFSRSTCVAFRDSLTSRFSEDVALPPGLQVWIARYKRTHTMEAQAFSEEMTGVRPFKGYKILVITYVVGSFIFQLTFPRWAKATRHRPTAPFFEIVGDVHSVPVWPGVTEAYWPPPLHVDRRSLEDFRERFRRLRVRRE